jgi:hypothetical protein
MAMLAITQTGAPERHEMKIATLKVSGRFTKDGYDDEYEEGFDEEALEDGPGQALLVYDNGRWELFTSEEDDRSSHGHMQHTDLAEAVRDARQLLQGKGYEVEFKLHAEDPD